MRARMVLIRIFVHEGLQCVRVQSVLMEGRVVEELER